MDYYAYQEELQKLRREFHQIPEIGLNEFKTTEKIIKYLEDSGLKVEPLEPTGCTTFILVDPSYKTAILRAEIDAIPVKEKAKVPYASLHEGVMHACCHDCNIAEALVLARLISLDPKALSVNVRFVFEPAEEIGMGSQLMIEQGVLEQPSADYFIMFHFAGHEDWGMEINHYSASAAIWSYDIFVKGHSVHWSVRERGTDALFVASKLAVWLGEMNEQKLVPNPYVVGTGILKSGSLANTMAERAHLSGSIRCHTMEELLFLKKMVTDHAAELEAQYGASIEIQWKPEPILPIVNDHYMVEVGDKVGKEVYGDAFHPIDYLYLAGDNAFRYFEHCKGIFLVFCYKNPRPPYGLHNGRMEMDDSQMYLPLEVLHKFLQNL